MAKLIDLTGQKFGRLTVIERVEDHITSGGYHITQWLCECECGNKCVVRRNCLRNGDTKSCGCYSKDQAQQLGLNNKIYNTFDLSREYGVGYDNFGKEFYFDLEDYEKIKECYWYVTVDEYVRNSHGVGLHRILFPNAEEIDHKNHIKYDNRKANLRPTTHMNNMKNKVKYKNNISGVVGVYWKTREQKWGAQITYNKIQKDLGLFNNKEDAIKARKEAEEKYFNMWSYENSIKN